MRILGLLAVFIITIWGAACGRADAQADAAPSSQTSAQASSQAEEAVSVRVVKAETTAVQAWIYAQGTARARQREFLSFANQGRVAYVDPKLRVGSKVKKGQVIAYLEPERVAADLSSAQAALAGRQADLAAARAAQTEAQANLDLAQTTYQRYRVLLEQNSASRQEYDQARAQLEQARAAKQRADVQIKAAQAQVESARAQVAQARVIVSDSRLVSPINGVLARLNIEQGRFFSPQVVQTGTEQGALRTVPAVVIDASQFEIRVDLPAFAFRQVSEGAEVVVGLGRVPAQGVATQATDVGPPPDSLPASQPDSPLNLPQANVRGKVHAVSPSLDPETRTFEVVIHTTSDNPRLQDGEFVAVWIAGQHRDQAVTVPLEALRYRNAEPFLFVVDAQTGIAQERQVKLGPQEAGQRAILSGVREGELVVTEGKARLNDGQRVRILGTDAPATSPASAPASGTQ